MKKLLFTFILLALFWTGSSAQVTIKQGTFPTMCQGGSAVLQLTPIVIKETSVNDFGGGTWVAYEMAAPTGYQYNISAASLTFYGPTGAISFPANGIGNYNLLFTVAGINNPASIDSIKITGLYVNALIGAPTSANIYRVAATDYPAPDEVQNGNNPGDNKLHGVLTSIPNPAPTISYTPDPYYCNKENVNNTLTAAPAGGTWTGTGVTTNKFNAYTLAANTYTLTYSVINGGLCTNQSTVDVLVKASPTVSLSSSDADNIICAGQSVTFTGTSTGSSKRYQFFKNNIPVTALSTSALYTTTTLANNDQITVVSDNGNFTCPDTSSAITMTVITSPNPTVSVSGLPAIICSNTTGTFPISTSPAGGTLTGSGISGSTFSPSLAGAGTYTLTYSVVSGGCTFSATTPAITVIGAPQLSVTSSDADNIICKGDPVTLSVNTFGTTSTIYYRTNVTSAFGPVSAMTHLYNNIANGDVLDVKVTNSDGSCAVFSTSFAMTVGEIPIAYFKWNTACGSSIINLDDSSYVLQSGSTITKWYWDYQSDNNYDLVGTTSDHAYNYNAYGNYSIKLKVETNYGCNSSNTKKIALQSTITPTIHNPYTEPFKVSDGAWSALGDSSTWNWGPAYGDSLGTGSRKVWATGSIDGKYKNYEVSYLQSPCIDMSGLDKPMMSIKLWSRTIHLKAGAMLEASTDGGVNWLFVGKVGVGIDWYDTPGVSGLANVPPSQNHSLNEGWNGMYTGWKVAKINLDKFAGNPTVKFRISFGAEDIVGGGNRTFGIAVDSVWIGNRTKRVVLEHFTNTLNKPYMTSANTAVDLIRDKRKKDVSAVYYHTSFPAADPYNGSYPVGPNSKVLYYGVSADPRTVLDGSAYNGSDYSSAGLDTNDVDSRILETAKFDLALSTYITTVQIQAAVRIKYVYPYGTYGAGTTTEPDQDVVLNTIIVDDSASNPNDNILYSSVVRQCLPDAAGSYISKTWQTNDSLTFSFTWPFPNGFNSSKLGVVAFLQNYSTKEIFQSVYIKGQGNSGSPVVASIEDKNSESNNVLLYPNPADNEVTILSVSETIANWIIYDNLGKEIKSGNPDKSVRGITIDTNDLSNGIYCIKINLTNTSNTYLKKIIINH